MNEWVGLFVGATAVLAFLGTGTVFVLSGRQKARIINLEGQATDLRNDVVDRDRRITFLEQENAARLTKVQDLETHVAALEKLKLGDAYFAAMRDQIAAGVSTMEANHRSIMSGIAVLESQSRDVLALLGEQRRG